MPKEGAQKLIELRRLMLAHLPQAALQHLRGLHQELQLFSKLFALPPHLLGPARGVVRRSCWGAAGRRGRGSNPTSYDPPATF